MKVSVPPAAPEMGGGNGQKSKMAREKRLEKQKAAKGRLLASSAFLCD